MRRKSGVTVSVTTSPEVELQWEARVTPVVPAVTQCDPEDGHPEEGGEVEDVRLVLGPTQIKSAKKLLREFVVVSNLTDARVEDLVRNIFTDVLDVRHIEPDDDDFREAAEMELDADEDDAHEEREREDRHAE